MKEKRNSLELEELTGSIIGAAIAVHKELGPGFLETIYENALAVELSHRGIVFEKQQIVPVFYKGTQVGEHRLDFLVEGKIVVELKAMKELEDIHCAQVRSYLKATHLKHGLLMNFATMPLTTKRVIFE